MLQPFRNDKYHIWRLQSEPILQMYWKWGPVNLNLQLPSAPDRPNIDTDGVGKEIL